MSQAILSPSEKALPDMATAEATRFSIAQYHRMLDTGILMDGDRVELIEGHIVQKHVRYPPHEMALRRLTARLPKRLPTGWFLQIQGAVTLQDSEPEPDGVILRGDETTCDGRLPGPDDIGLVLEVSDSSRAFDRRVKGQVYARAGIAVYWLLNVSDRLIEVYSDPNAIAEPPVYLTRKDYAIGQEVPVILDTVTVATVPVSDLLS